MKKFLSIILSLLILFSLSACANNQVDEEGTIDTNKGGVPISTAEALKSDGFEFIYNLEEIPASFWNEENSLECKKNFEEEIMLYKGDLAGEPLDFEVDVDADDDPAGEEYYKLVFNDNKFLIPGLAIPFERADDGDNDGIVALYVMGNDLKFYQIYFKLVDETHGVVEQAQRKTEIEEGKWTASFCPGPKTIAYIYKLNENKYLHLYGGSPEFSGDPCTDEQLEELCEYVLSHIEVNKVEKKDFIGVRLAKKIELDENYCIDFSKMKIEYMGSSRSPYQIGIIEDDTLNFRVFTEKGKKVSFAEFQPEIAFDMWKEEYIEIEPYNEHISLLKTRVGYEGIYLTYNEKYYIISTEAIEADRVSDVDEYVNEMMNSVVLEKK
jgi:hypothetical protein